MDKSVETGNANLDVTSQEPQSPQPSVDYVDPAAMAAQQARAENGGRAPQREVTAAQAGSGQVYIAPEGVTAQDIFIEGNDLIVVLPDDTEVRIVDALNQFEYVEIGELYFPLGGAGGLGDPLSADQVDIEPAAPLASSGGSFNVSPGQIDDAFDLTALLPPTSLAFGLPEQEELNEFLIDDDKPSVGVAQNVATDDDGTINGTSVGNGTVMVDYGNDAPEDALAAMVLSPEGLNGQLSTPDGTPIVFVLDAQTGDLVGSAGGEEVLRISITGVVDNGDGTFTYSYQVIQSAPVGQPGSGDIADILSGVGFTVTDASGDTDSGSFDVTVNDSVPGAQDDSYSQAEEDAPVSGNVRENDADGADVDAEVTAFNLTQGAGNLVVNADGSFTYTPEPGEEGQVTFTYTLTDSDGDTSTATVTIDLLPDSTPETSWITVDGDEAVVDEAALDDGSNSASDAESTSGTIDVATGNDDLASLVVNGVDVTDGGVVDGQYGTLVVSYDPNTDTYSWVYTLNDNTTDHPVNSTGGDEGISEDFTVVATDSDGDEASDTLTVTVLDDVPAAEDDIFYQSNDDSDGGQTNENEPVSGDVSLNDVEGADNPGTYAEVPDSLTGSGDLVFNDDGTFVYTPAAGEEGVVTFEYTLTDTDGDVSTAVVTIRLDDDSVPVAGEASNLNTDDDNVVDSDQGGVTIDYGNDSDGASFAFNLDGLAGSLQTLDGNDVVWSLENGSIVGRDTNNNVVIQIDVVATDNNDGTVTYNYEVTQNVPLKHSDPNSEDDAVITINFTGTDGDDGDEVDGSFTVTINDSLPTANDDSDDQASQNGENTAVTGNVKDNDDDGADGTALVTDYTLTQGNGSLTVDPDGSFSYTPAAGEEGEIIFTYEITDEDGDTDTATVTITLEEDDTPVAGKATDLNTDDDNVVDSDQGSVTIDYGDDSAGATFDFNLDGLAGTLQTLDGNDVVWSLENGSIVGKDTNNNVVIQIDVVPTDNNDGTVTYNYEVTQNVPLKHSDPNSEDNASITINFTGTDGDDGDEVDGSFDVIINDSLPTANDDGPVPVAEDTSVEIDVFKNDDAGADGVDLATGVALETGPSKGSVVYNNDGTFTYTPDAGAEGADSFTYTITDADGDTSTATVILDIATDSTPSVESTTNLVVDEDALSDGNDDATTDRNDETTSPNESLTDTSGEAVVQFGNDVPGNSEADYLNAIALKDDPALDNQLVTVDGDAVTFALVGGDLVGSANGVEVIRISITGASLTDTGEVTYTYSVQLADGVSLEHADGALENILTLAGVGFTVTDADNDTADGSFDVAIYDDVPEADDRDVDQPSEDANVVIDVRPDISEGADGVDLTENVGITFTDPVVANNTGQNGEGVLSYDDNGTFTYDPADGQTGTVTFTYTITDEDGDTDTATVTIDLVGDSTPTVTANDANVDEDGLVPEGEGPASLATDTSTLTVTFGNDVPGDLLGAVTFDPATVAALTGYVSGVDPVVFSIDQNTGDIVGVTQVGNVEVIRISIENAVNNNNGTVTYNIVTTLSGPFDHAIGNGENDITLSGIGVIATDSDGDSSSDTFDVVVNDDVPESLTGDQLFVQNQVPSSASEDLNFEAGADGIGGAVFTQVADATGVLVNGTDGIKAYDSNGNEISNGSPVFWWGFGTDTLYGLIGVTDLGGLTLDQFIAANPGLVAVTASLDPDTGEWSALIDVQLSNGTETEFLDLDAGIGGGNVPVFALGANNANNNPDNIDVAIQGLTNDVITSVNSSSGNLGIAGGNDLSDNDIIHIKFVTNMVVDGSEPTGFHWDGVVETTSFTQEISRVKGGGSGANLEIRAYRDADPDDDLNPNGDGVLVQDGDDIPVEIIDVRILDMNGNDITDSFGGTAAVVNGVAIITNMSQDMQYQIITNDPFTAVEVENTGSGNNNPSLGGFSIGTASAGEPFDLPFGIRGTDGDGDIIDSSVLLSVIPEDQPLARDDEAILNDAGDTDGNNATITVDVFANDEAGSDGVDLVNDVSFGSLTGAGQLVYNDDGTFTYTPDNSDPDIVTFEYTLEDANGDTMSATVTLDLTEPELQNAQLSQFSEPVLLETEDFSSDAFAPSGGDEGAKTSSFGEPELVSDEGSVELSMNDFMEGNSLDLSDMLGQSSPENNSLKFESSHSNTENHSINSGLSADVDDIVAQIVGSGSS